MNTKFSEIVRIVGEDRSVRGRNDNITKLMARQRLDTLKEIKACSKER